MKHFRIWQAVVVCVALLAGCHGYKPDRQLTPEDLKAADMATQLSTDADALRQKAPDIDGLKDLSDSSEEFDHNSRRFGPNSLEARNSFDRVRFRATQAVKVITAESHADLLPDVTKIQSQIKEIGRLLGYKD